MGTDNARARPSPAVQTRPPNAVTRRWATATPSPSDDCHGSNGRSVAVQARRLGAPAVGRPAREPQRARRRSMPMAMAPGVLPARTREQRRDGVRGAIDAACRRRPIRQHRAAVADGDAALGERRRRRGRQLAGRGPAGGRVGRIVEEGAGVLAQARDPGEGVLRAGEGALTIVGRRAACRRGSGAGSHARRPAASARRESARRALVRRRSSRKAGTSRVARASGDATCQTV